MSLRHCSLLEKSESAGSMFQRTSRAALRGEEDKTGEVLVFYLVAMLGSRNLAPPFLVLAGVEMRASLEERDLHVGNSGGAIVRLEGGGVGDVVVEVVLIWIVFRMLWLLLGIADGKAFGITTLSSRRVSLSSSRSAHFEIGVELLESVQQAVEEDVASRGPAD